MELADAARDQLGELAAEIEHGDEGMRLTCRVVARRPLRTRGMERGLEIRLHLGVVGSKDAVAGIRRLAVDRPAFTRHARSRTSGAAAMPAVG